MRRPSGTIKVAFPKEDPKKTRERVKKNKKYGHNWQLYEAVIKFDSSTFNDSDIRISTMKNGQPNIPRVVIVEKKRNSSPDVPTNDAVTTNNDALTTNEDSTTKTNKNISLLPKKRYRNIDMEKTFSTSKVKTNLR